MELSTIIIVAGIAVFAIIIGVGIGFVTRKKIDEGNLHSGRKTADSIVADATKEAENVKKAAELEAKDMIFEGKNEFEKETRERRKELQSLERRVQQKEENLDKKSEAMDRKDADFQKREKTVATQEKKLKDMETEVEGVIAEQKARLEGLAGISAEEAKRMLLENMENEAKHEGAKLIKRIEDESKAEADKKAKDIIALAIQRYSGEYVAERTVSVVNLPNDEMKGRIIGREGRNIRAIEAATGIDIIIDDTPEAVILSGHNPVRREIAKLSLERLITDGRIHPSRIEEIVTKVETEVNQAIMEAGERAIFDTGLHGIHKEIQKLIGRLKFRTSYAQNVYSHSLEVAFICGVMASELGLPTKIARRAGLLHDIGKAVDHEIEGPHAAIGADMAKKYGEAPKIVAAIGQHHDDTPESIFGILVQAADTLSAARPGARREMLESYINRLDDLEKIAKGFGGVEKAYALQAGREIRVIVETAVSDEGAVVLSKDIARQIEKDLTYPGQIKVTVVRESRAVEFAK
ncbi:MAG TPA: ribonuclease Y [Deltaproteobacteria bacterium]|nr:MAG: ribonuclease Y [Deltaproteobacteria bacterium GWA2_55_82]OGQ63087.1 MAG: ribonuclease Y [Deltaproteobacteria bacterium RIFCSPLOWO2_02_FULL_55_12]OIJ73546.1 MAG: ribonuclease Y [Deltaproteobacteria bacterium GWC2_55_46]HBG47679.1 ribonuclease Y [Deltaproteobacteria bacterium]HCY12099.1 ribonuclease Y [Deltaproteobacteria bacterium]